MTVRMKFLISISLAYLFSCSTASRDSEFPVPSELPATKDLPDLLLMFDGNTRISEPEQWSSLRRPELQRLFQHYMYGFAPGPAPVKHRTNLIDDQAFDGAATISEVHITVGERKTVDIVLLLATPNDVAGPIPVILQLNKCGNQSVTTHPSVPVSTSWVSPTCDGPNQNRAYRAHRFQLEHVVKSGYAVATFHESDVDPDKPDFTDGVHAVFPTQVAEEIRWGTIAAWSWGLRRAIDYLQENPKIDNNRIVIFGHSRRGKTSLFTAALDERVNLVVSHQSGTGGAALSRSYAGESVKQINDRFPHWFNDVFPMFNEREDRLPIDQHELIALVAPRSAFISNAEDDLWADPEGTYRAVVAADAAWELLGKGGFDQPGPGQTNYSAELAYFVRPGKHDVTLEDWMAIIKYADTSFGIRRSDSYSGENASQVFEPL